MAKTWVPDWTADDILAGVDDEDPIYESAGQRLRGLGLHQSHRWTYFTEGDCWRGIHARIECSECELPPLGRSVCYFELRGGERAVKAMLKARGITVNPAATEPCPGSSHG